jgi:hypothetical protein
MTSSNLRTVSRRSLHGFAAIVAACHASRVLPHSLHDSDHRPQSAEYNRHVKNEPCDAFDYVADKFLGFLRSVLNIWQQGRLS